MTEVKINELIADTEKLVAFVKVMRASINTKHKRIDGRKLYLVYILDFAIGATEAIILLNKHDKMRDSLAIARILFELRVDAHFLYVTSNFNWTDILVACNDVETINAIKINTDYAGESTKAEIKRIESGKAYLSDIYLNRNSVPIVGSISEGSNHILSYNEETDTYKSGLGNRGCADFSIFGKCKLIDATILQDLDRGQKAATHYRTVYKYYSQFVHPSLLGMTEYRGGVSQAEPVRELDIKTEFKLIFYYLFSIIKLAQEKVPVTGFPGLDRKFRTELKKIQYGDIEKDIF